MNKCVKLLIGLYLFAAAVIGGNATEDEDRKAEISSLERKLFNFERPSLKPEDVSDGLRRLADLYTRNGDPDDDGKMKMVRRIQAFEGINEKICKVRGAYTALDFVETKYLSLRYYIEKHSPKQLELCSNLIRENLEKIDNFLVQKMEKLGRFVIEGKNRNWDEGRNHKSYRKNHLFNAILKFLVEESDLSKIPKSQENFDREYNKHIVNPCKEFERQLDYQIFTDSWDVSFDIGIHNIKNFIDDTVLSVSRGLSFCLVDKRADVYKEYLKREGKIGRMFDRLAHKSAT